MYCIQKKQDTLKETIAIYLLEVICGYLTIATQLGKEMPILAFLSWLIFISLLIKKDNREDLWLLWICSINVFSEIYESSTPFYSIPLLSIAIILISFLQKKYGFPLIWTIVEIFLFDVVMGLSNETGTTFNCIISVLFATNINVSNLIELCIILSLHSIFTIQSRIKYIFLISMCILPMLSPYSFPLMDQHDTKEQIHIVVAGNVYPRNKGIRNSYLEYGISEWMNEYSEEVPEIIVIQGVYSNGPLNCFKDNYAAVIEDLSLMTERSESYYGWLTDSDLISILSEKYPNTTFICIANRGNPDGFPHSYSGWIEEQYTQEAYIWNNGQYQFANQISQGMWRITAKDTNFILTINEKYETDDKLFILCESITNGGEILSITKDAPYYTTASAIINDFYVSDVETGNNIVLINVGILLSILIVVIYIERKETKVNIIQGKPKENPHILLFIAVLTILFLIKPSLKTINAITQQLNDNDVNFLLGDWEGETSDGRIVNYTFKDNGEIFINTQDNQEIVKGIWELHDEYLVFSYIEELGIGKTESFIKYRESAAGRILYIYYPADNYVQKLINTSHKKRNTTTVYDRFGEKKRYYSVRFFEDGSLDGIILDATKLESEGILYITQYSSDSNGQIYIGQHHPGEKTDIAKDGSIIGTCKHGSYMMDVIDDVMILKSLSNKTVIYAIEESSWDEIPLPYSLISEEDFIISEEDPNL